MHKHLHNSSIGERPSGWVQRWAGLIAAESDVLDLACGGGRHSRYLAGLGHRILAVDRDEVALAGLRGVDDVEILAADLESGAWPLGNRRFGGIVVTNYLHRPLFARILSALLPSGVLIYETFAVGNEKFGKPSNPAFLLRSGELLEAARGLRIVAYEDLEVSEPRPAMVQRICAVQLPVSSPG